MNEKLELDKNTQIVFHIGKFCIYTDTLCHIAILDTLRHLSLCVCVCRYIFETQDNLVQAHL